MMSFSRARSASSSLPGDTEPLAVRDVDEEAARQRDLGRQPGALRLHRVLDRLHEQLLAARDQILDLLAVPLALELGDDDLVDVEKPVLLEPDLDERGLHARKHVVDDPEVDVPGDRPALGPLEVHLGDPVVLDHGDALLADVDRDQQLALRGGQRRPARRLAAALGAAALPGATTVGRPLGPLAPLRLLPRGLLGSPPRAPSRTSRRVGSASAAPSAAGRFRPRPPRLPRRRLLRSASASAPVCGRFGGRALRRGLRLSRGGRNFCRCALGRVLLVLLVLPSKPGQRVPLLVVARAGVRQPTGMPASRSGCRKPWPCSVGPRGAGYQCAARGLDAEERAGAGPAAPDRARRDHGAGNRRLRQLRGEVAPGGPAPREAAG